MNYFPFHIGDYAAHTAHLEPMEDLAYRRLMDRYYLDEGFATSDPAELARLIRMKANVAEVETVLREFFVMKDGRYTHERCDKEIAKYKAMEEGGRRGAEKRWPSKKDRAGDSPPIAPLSPPVSPPNANQEPRTNNQEPNQYPREREAEVPPEPPPRSINFENFEPTTRAGAIAMLLRDGGIQINSTQPVVQEWAKRPEVTDEILVQAALKAKEAKPRERIGSAYLAPIVEQMLKPRAMDSPAAKFPAWRTDDREADKLGRLLGVKPATMETYDVYRSRIARALREHREAEAA